MSYHPEYFKLLLAEKLLNSVEKSSDPDIAPVVGDIKTLTSKLDKIMDTVECGDALLDHQMGRVTQDPDPGDKHERLAMRFMELIGELGE